MFRQTKMLLPTYDVFDEARYFVPAEAQSVCASADSGPVALTICEDAWNDKQFWERRLYRRDPVEELAQPARRLLDQHQRLALITWASANCADEIFRGHRAPAQGARGLRQPGGRQRSDSFSTAPVSPWTPSGT